jgi:hypothetical protein
MLRRSTTSTSSSDPLWRITPALSAKSIQSSKPEYATLWAAYGPERMVYSDLIHTARCLHTIIVVYNGRDGPHDAPLLSPAPGCWEYVLVTYC